MKKQLLYILILILSLIQTNQTLAQVRRTIDFNKEWKFVGQSVTGLEKDEMVTLPHSWNAADAQLGIAYHRGICRYVKTFDAEDDWRNKRVFIRFDGVNITSEVIINGKNLGEHRGGYAAFVYEISDHLKFSEENNIEVIVSNEATLDVLPLVGDFNNYGGIYRPVSLLVTEPICISPLDYASPGIYIEQKSVSEAHADLEVVTKLSNNGEEASINLVTTIFNGSGRNLQSIVTETILPKEGEDITQHFSLQNPHLWNGKKDPYLYQIQVDVYQKNKLIDSNTEPLGLRYFHVDAENGFFLNGKALDLRGVSRHQDRKDKASAISQADHREDMDIMLDMGINALRLAHYQHAEVIYEMADSNGLVVWAELPWVGMPAGFLSESNGYEKTDAFHENAKQQLLELIRQNFNHPSILFWCIFNEIQSPEGKEPTAFIKELNEIVKQEDPSRMTVGASMLSPQKFPHMHDITDLIAWNRYYGWYYKLPEDMGIFLDELHRDFPGLKIGISEYGAGGSINQHSDQLSPPNPMGSPHPEQWQSHYHEENLRIFDERPFVWGTFVWNMFDFGSHFRKEGDHYGMNDKGLVTYDRKTKKDAFYFYKSNWSEEPVLHITSSRYLFREEAETQVRVYTNIDNVSLEINDRQYPTKSPERGVIVWDDVTLDKGNNGVIVKAEKEGNIYTDDCVWVVESPYEGLNLFREIFDFMMIANRVSIFGLFSALFIWFFGIRKVKEGATWKKILLWFIFSVMVLTSLIILAFKFYMSTRMGA
ncbi:MAG: beta-galactosidase [Saprospiraceae bacterium]|nr:beta-galactosidase [Saprospiraceae bacterium]